MTWSWDDPWADDLASWEDVAEVLHSDWDRVEHAALGLWLERAEGLLAIDERGRTSRNRTRRGYRRTWSAATLKDMSRVPYVREFIDLLSDHPPFQQKTRN